MIKKKKNLSLVAFIAVSASIGFFNFSMFPKNILSWDVFGYYIYLPMIFIHNNWGLQDINLVHHILEQYQNSSTLYQCYQTETGYWVMRYPMGMAILYSPFFFIGHLAAWVSHSPMDGFSLPYQSAVLLGGVFYSVCGFWFLRKILLKYFSDAAAAITMLVIYLGTNYFFHSSFHGSNAMTHNYLFTVYTLIIWFTICWHETFRLRYALLLGLLCGINIISRPSEVVCLLIPLLWKTGSEFSFAEKIKLFFRYKIHIFLFFLVMAVVCMPQFIYWKIISGKFLFYSYGDNPGEGFEFLHPNILEVLFSFRKGWLLYTPIMIFAVAGIFFSLRRLQNFSYAITVYFLINIYIVSSWSAWWFAESFGQRSLIQSYAVLTLPLGFIINYFISAIPIRLRNSALAVLCLLIFLNLFQTWQFLHGIIHPSRMTGQAYMAVFGKTKIPLNLEKLLLIDRESAESSKIDESEYAKTKEWTEDFEHTKNASLIEAHSGTHSFEMDSAKIYSPVIEKMYKEITTQDYAKLKVSVQVYCPGNVKPVHGSLVAAFDHKGYSYGYKRIDTESLNIEPDRWTEISMLYLTPVIRVKTDKLKVYFLQRGSAIVYVDDIKVEVWEKNHPKEIK
jgi:hypothetical protein